MTPSEGMRKQTEFRYGRGARLGLFLLLLGTVLFAGVALFVKFKLEAFRAMTETGLEARTGARLSMGPVSVNGFRGLRIDDLEVALAMDNGPSITLTAPVAYVHINLNELLYGRIAVDRVVLDGSTILVNRPEGADWFAPEGYDADAVFSLSPNDAFRVTGKDCSLEIHNVVGDTRLVFDDVRFDVSRPVDALDLTASLEGNLSGDAEKRVSVKLTLASVEDFDLRIQMAKVAAEDVNVFLPAPHQLVSAGTTKPTLWVNGRPDNTVMVSLEAPFEGLVIRDQPDFLGPATGTLIIYATYATENDVLTVTTAKAESTDLDGVLDGSISFSGPYPEFDLRFRATRLPIEPFLDWAFDGQISEYGRAALVLNEPHELVIALEGTSQSPLSKWRLTADSGEFSFSPSDPTYPDVRLFLGTMEGAWDSRSQSFSGDFVVRDGAVIHEASGLSAQGLKGTILVRDEVISVAPINAEITGNAFVGSATYNVASGDGEMTLTGMLSDLETTSLSDAIEKTLIEGSVNLLHCKASKTGDLYSVEAQVDATQARLDYSWWFSKPMGIGAKGTVHLNLIPNRSAVLVIEDAEVASSQVDATATLVYAAANGGRWLMDKVRANSGHLDVNALGKCLLIPYRVTGGSGTSAHFSWERVAGRPGAWRETLSCYLDEVTVLPDGENVVSPMVCEDVTVEVSMEEGAESLGVLTLVARKASMPPVGARWFAPMRPVGRTLPPRSWTFNLNADSIELPPWKGANFSGQAYANSKTTGFYAYGADIENGRIDGSYDVIKAENAYAAKVTWSKVPVTYFIDHLGYPPVLTGSITGNVVYSLDRDDPGTLDGKGSFEITDGQFSTDFLYQLLERQIEDELAALPPSLEFSLLHAEVGFERDVVHTPVVRLVSEDLRLDGRGSFVRDGDMDYTIEVAVSPEMAAKIPSLYDSINVEGYRLAQRDIELAFEIGGPTFNPQGQLAELPPTSVTLVSGGLEMASEAIKLIDVPRRILIDLLKMGGGIVGATK